MWLDLVILLLITGGIYRGWLTGFTQQFWSSLGFFIGLLLGRILEPYAINLAHSPSGRVLVTLVTFLGCGLICLSIGEYIGMHFKFKIKDNGINKLDNSLGSFVSVLAAIFSIWLLASLALTLPNNSLRSLVRSSYIISALNQILPPAPKIISSLGNLIDPNGFPDVFIGNEPVPRNDVNLPALGEFAAAVSADRDSVVRIKGQGCGGVVSGSGFVVKKGLVATNAHVVAGISNPYVQDVSGTHRASVVLFDPNLDFAVLRVGNLAGKPLAVSPDKVQTETPAAILGYPGGGDFNVGPAAILEQIRASGRNIYGDGYTLRDVYEIQGTVVPGNSGGPLIAKDGSVIGIVFAESTTYKNVGYALTTSKAIQEINQTTTSASAVSTGRCAE